MPPRDLADYFAELKSSGRQFSEQAETEVFHAMQREIDAEPEKDVQTFMAEKLEAVCTEGEMLLSYVYSTLWREWIEGRKKINSTYPPMALCLDLEHILASRIDSSAYTKNSTGPRYPLTIPSLLGKPKSIRNPDHEMSAAEFSSSYYAFGVHQFYVGQRIWDMLRLIERRYGLDFKILEAKAASKNSS